MTFDFDNLVEMSTSRPGAISTKTPYGAIDLISQFLKYTRQKIYLTGVIVFIQCSIALENKTLISGKIIELHGRRKYILHHQNLKKQKS